MQVKKQQLDPYMEQHDSKLGKYIKAVYCHSTYLAYIQSVSCEIMDWMNHRLESRLLREVSTTSDVQMIFAVVMSGCESWTVKKAECQRIDTFELWRRLLRVPWIARRTNQLIFKETNPEYSLEGLMLKLKL